MNVDLLESCDVQSFLFWCTAFETDCRQSQGIKMFGLCRPSNRKVLHKSDRSLLHSCVSHTLCYCFYLCRKDEWTFLWKDVLTSNNKDKAALDLPQESLLESPATHSSLWVESSYLVHVDLNWIQLFRSLRVCILGQCCLFTTIKCVSVT
jgi:hypothetical protein